MSVFKSTIITAGITAITILPTRGKSQTRDSTNIKTRFDMAVDTTDINSVEIQAKIYAFANQIKTERKKEYQLWIERNEIADKIFKVDGETVNLYEINMDDLNRLIYSTIAIMRQFDKIVKDVNNPFYNWALQLKETKTDADTKNIKTQAYAFANRMNKELEKESRLWIKHSKIASKLWKKNGAPLKLSEINIEDLNKLVYNTFNIMFRFEQTTDEVYEPFYNWASQFETAAKKRDFAIKFEDAKKQQDMNKLSVQKSLTK